MFNGCANDLWIAAMVEQSDSVLGVSQEHAGFLSGGISDLVCSDGARMFEKVSSDIVGAIHQMSHDLVGAVAVASSDASVEKIGFAIFVAFIGAFSAFLFNFLHWRVTQKRQDMTSLGQNLIDLIDRLETLSVEYWVASYDDSAKDALSVSEVHIKTLLRQINKYEIVLSNGLRGKKYSDVRLKLNEFSSEIYDLVTGDGFESTTREPSKMKAIKIARECSDARVAVSSTLIRM